jgi:hypothetical protein
MAVSVSKTLLFPTLTNIKFSDLRSEFKEVSNGPISASELRRSTNTSSSNPIVPDATENAAVSTGNNLKVSQFRNTIKYYNLNQSGTDLNLDIFAQTWNANLSKNIVKKMNINGTCGSNTTATAALLVNAITYNLQVIVNGFVFGAGGAGGTSSSGGNGGPAMSLISLGGAINLLTVGGSQVYGGGGGGAKGATGGFGANGTCSYIDSYVTGAQCGSCPGCGPGYSQNCYSDGSCGGGKNPSTSYKSNCSKTAYFQTGNPPGGAGGNGGLGQGYGQARTDGSGGAGGSASDCGGAVSVDTQYGGTGETGGNGGDWGSDGGGTSAYGASASGRSVAGSNYTIDANSITSVFRGPR